MKKAAIVPLALGCVLAIQAFAGTPKLPTPQAGLYVNEEFRFSVNYPENWVNETPQPGEVLRASNPTPYKIPVVTAGVADASESASLDPEAFTAAAQRAIPGSKGFKVLSQEDVTLNDGTAAKALTYEWTWADGATGLLTGALITIKDGKYFNTTVTTLLSSDTQPEQLLEIAKSWKFY